MATSFFKLKQQIEANLNNAMPHLDQERQIIVDAMAYSLLAGGKRVRPALCLATIELFRPLRQSDIEFALNIEMIHTYSLIHDDLPAVDNDDLRRGMPACHIKFGEDIAIFAGDALLNLAAERLLAQVIDQSTKLAAQAVLTATGCKGMIGGQVMDLAEVSKTLSYLQQMHRLKSGALIEASVVSGAILGGASVAHIAQLETFGRKLGLAFQIRDDLLDVVSTSATLGKTVGKDARDQKTTYVSLLGKEGAEEMLRKVCSEATRSIDDIRNEGFDLSVLEGVLDEQVERNA